jgi:hypothetical protein
MVMCPTMVGVGNRVCFISLLVKYRRAPDARVLGGHCSGGHQGIGSRYGPCASSMSSSCLTGLGRLVLLAHLLDRVWSTNPPRRVARAGPGRSVRFAELLSRVWSVGTPRKVARQDLVGPPVRRVARQYLIGLDGQQEPCAYFGYTIPRYPSHVML